MVDGTSFQTSNLNRQPKSLKNPMNSTSTYLPGLSKKQLNDPFDGVKDERKGKAIYLRYILFEFQTINVKLFHNRKAFLTTLNLFF